MIPVFLFHIDSEYGALPADASAGRFSYCTKAVRFAAEKNGCARKAWSSKPPASFLEKGGSIRIHALIAW